MSANFEKAFLALLGNEGGYVNDPRDSGGETNHGVTLRVARASGYMGKMKDLSLDMAKQIYEEQYWSPAFDSLAYVVAFQLFDASVNHGQRQAIKLLQKALGAKQDGVLGPATIREVQIRGPINTVALFNCERLDFYTLLDSWPAFSKGWARRVANNIRSAIA